MTSQPRFRVHPFGRQRKAKSGFLNHRKKTMTRTTMLCRVLFSHKRKFESAQKTPFERIKRKNLPVTPRSPAKVAKRVLPITPTSSSLKTLQKLLKMNSVSESNKLIQYHPKIESHILERLAQTWNSPIYAFFEPRPKISVVNGRRCHEFVCSAPVCKGNRSERCIVRRYLDTADKGSTSNMWKHARHCWGEDIVKKANDAKDELTLNNIREGLAVAKNGQDSSIITSFD